MQTKILLFFFAACTMATTLHAQLKKGTIFLGGQIGFSTEHTDVDEPSRSNPPTGNKTTSINFSPAIGKAVRENLVVGIDLTYQYQKVQSLFPQLQKNISYGAGFFVRRYTTLGKGFYLFGQVRAGGSYYSKRYYDGLTMASNSLTRGFTAQLAVYPGIAYNVSRKFQLEAGFADLGFITFDHSRETFPPSPGDRIIYNNFSLGSSLSSFSGITLGFRYLLN